jgi:ribosomal protein S18 acetylase RimI-like enzyme
MSEANVTAEAERAREWVHAAQAAVCDVIEPWEHGTVVRATRYPSYWDYNLVRVEDDVELGVDELAEFADEALDGLRHRQMGFEVAEAGERLRAGFTSLGWLGERLVWMLHAGPRTEVDGLTVEQVHYETVRHLRVEWHREDFPDVDASDYLDHAGEVAALRGAQVFAAFEGGRPVAFAQLERAGEDAEIASVFVLADHRGRGLGTALTRAAVAAAADARDLWIVADDEGRAKQIYARLGFRPVWTVQNVLRLPSRG